MSIAAKTTSNSELVYSSLELITPEDAKRMLERTTFRNRPLRQKHVNYLADLISAGFWKINGDTIKLDVRGNVLDGQHRLHAIIKSQRPVTTLVTRGLKTSVFDAIDTGRMVRSDGNVLSIAGQKNTKTLAATVKTVAAFDQIGHLAFSAGSSSREKHVLKAAPILGLMAEYEEVRKSVDFVCGLNNTRVFKPSSLISSIHYIFGRHSIVKRDRFFDNLRQNYFDSLTCPSRALYMAYQSEKTYLKMQASQRYRAALWFKTFSAYCDKRQISQLRFSDNEDFPTLS